jgi:hypothetical protein
MQKPANRKLETGNWKPENAETRNQKKLAAQGSQLSHAA